jgi:hypothetical protein
MMVSDANSSDFGQAGSTGVSLMPTKASPLGSIKLSQESPMPEIKNRLLPLPLKHYVRLAMEQRIVRQALMERANQRTPKPR